MGKNNLKKEVLSRIESGRVKMKPKAWFEIVKISAAVGMIASGIFAIFLINMALYLPKRAGALDDFRLGRIFHIAGEIPWLFIALAAILLGFSIGLYRNYEGGYKHRLLWVIILISFVALVFGFGLFRSGLNESLERGKGMKRFYQWNQDQFGPRHPKIKGFQSGPRMPVK